MLIRNACPRCEGHLHIEFDEYGFYKACITCGYTRDLEKLAFARWQDIKNPDESSLHYFNEISPLLPDES